MDPCAHRWCTGSVLLGAFLRFRCTDTAPAAWRSAGEGGCAVYRETYVREDQLKSGISG